MKNKYKICILGAGSYGTALAYVLSYTGHKVILYCRNKEQSDMINNYHINPKRFSKKRLSDNVKSSNNLKNCFKGTDIIFHCIPCQNTLEFLKKYNDIIPKNIPYISTSKGLYAETGELLSDIFTKFFDDNNIFYLSGPSFALEMMNNNPVSLILASKNLEKSKIIQKKISSDLLRIYLNEDVIGVEIGGALKNPIAIGIGIAIGLGYGKSTIAALITLGCKEMSLISKKLGGKSETLFELSGIGDLMLTCFSPMSRNYRFGVSIGEGKDRKNNKKHWRGC